MNSRCIHGILFHGVQQIAVGFADDTFIFAKADKKNVDNIIDTLAPFSEASALYINRKKSALVNISAQDFHNIHWEGTKIEKGTVFRHLGYPLDINVSNKDKIEWVMGKVQYKVSMWYASQWPLHARIRIVQAFLQLNVMHYLLLLDWKTCHIRDFECMLKGFLWNKKHNREMVLSAWDYVCQPRINESLGILNLQSHTIARREAFIMRVTSAHRPLWLQIFWKIIENAEVFFKGAWKLDAWNKFFSHAPLYTSSPTLNFLLRSFKLAASYLKWNGRQRYIGNSFASLSPYWSFLSNPPIAHSLGE
ncbi:hypothetical protein KP509_18G061600 [Ceratopteris richardii]|uniref:Reverse transcriptase domain-containing protein n=1 Tax=Ceratopteris richardii TaxID=49495 RepID=A0A8T2SS26_CERRI|nr:hypothetical protein KP509_18G061600 [Ceratopteris richardii]